MSCTSSGATVTVTMTPNQPHRAPAHRRGRVLGRPRGAEASTTTPTARNGAPRLAAGSHTYQRVASARWSRRPCLVLAERHRQGDDHEGQPDHEEHAGSGRKRRRSLPVPGGRSFHGGRPSWSGRPRRRHRVEAWPRVRLKSPEAMTAAATVSRRSRAAPEGDRLETVGAPVMASRRRRASRGRHRDVARSGRRRARARRAAGQSSNASGGGQTQTRLRSPYPPSMRLTGGQYLARRRLGTG